LVFAPLLVFAGKLAALARAGVHEYGALAQKCARDFDEKWLRGGAPADEPLLGSEDIESLADMGNSFGVIQQMRWVPFTFRDVLQVGVISLLPVLPLTLTMISLRDILRYLLRLIV